MIVLYFFVLFNFDACSYLDPMDDTDDDEDDVFSVEGLAQSGMKTLFILLFFEDINGVNVDPYEAARKLLTLLELDPSRSTESDIVTLKKFAKNRSIPFASLI